jgi:hypothetical protein
MIAQDTPSSPVTGRDTGPGEISIQFQNYLRVHPNISSKVAIKPRPLRKSKNEGITCQLIHHFVPIQLLGPCARLKVKMSHRSNAGDEGVKQEKTKDMNEVTKKRGLKGQCPHSLTMCV